jgi:hypothetical protein
VNFAIEGALPKGVKVGNLVAGTKDPKLRLGRLVELKDEYGIVVYSEKSDAQRHEILISQLVDKKEFMRAANPL